MTIKISQLGSVTTVLGNVLIPMVSNVAGTLTTLQGNVSQLKTFVLGTLETDVANLVANAGSQSASITTLTANAAVQAGLIADLTSNAAVQSGAITTANLAMKGYVDGQVSTLTGNAAVQAGLIADLQSNAAVQAGILGSLNAFDTANIIANVSTLQSDVVTLTSNAAAQAGSIATLTSNAAVQAGLIADLTSNAAVQAGILGSLNAFDTANIIANVSTLQSDVVTLTSNAAAQAGSIANISNGTTTFGNLIPSANVTYNLGSPAAQWKDLYLSGSTIYIGGGNIAVAGNTITTSLPFTATGTLSADDLVVTNSVGCGTIYAGQAELTGVTTLYETGYDGNIVTNTNGTVALTVSSDGSAWGAQGALVFEGNSPVGDGIIPSNDNQYSLGKLGYTWSSVHSQTVEVGDRINLPLGGALTDTIAPAGNAAVLIGPTNGAAAIAVASANVAISNSVDITAGNATVTIHNADTVTTHIWQFNKSGTVIFPDATEQTTAYSATLANTTPATSTSSGTKGDIVYDASYIYICVDTDQWIRALRDTW